MLEHADGEEEQDKAATLFEGGAMRMSLG